jgi:hypothetical protein
VVFPFQRHYSEQLSSNTRKKTSSKFHRSLVSRTVMPALEKGACEFPEAAGYQIPATSLLRPRSGCAKIGLSERSAHT